MALFVFYCKTKFLLGVKVSHFLVSLMTLTFLQSIVQSITPLLWAPTITTPRQLFLLLNPLNNPFLFVSIFVVQARPTFSVKFHSGQCFLNVTL